MAFPSIPTGGRILTSRTDTPGQTHTFPSLTNLTKNSGDLLIAIIVIYQGASPQFASWGGSFTEFSDNGGTTAIGIGCAYKFSTGSETGTFTVSTTVAVEAGMILMSISGAHASTIPEAGGYASGTLANADPGSLDPAGWATEDTLWIAVAGVGETSTGGTWQGISAAPSGYSGYVDTAVVNDVTGAVEGAVAFRQNSAASENPGTFTNDSSNTRWGALTIGVRPAAPLPQTVNIVAGTAAWSARPLTTTGAGATVNLVAPTAAWSALALTTTGAAATVNLVAPGAAWSARPLDVTVAAGPQTVNLVAPVAQWTARPLGINPTQRVIFLGGDLTPPSGYEVWLDASDAATITESGGLVSEWRDKANSYPMTASGTERPTTGSRTLNGRNVLEFNGANSLRNATQPPAGALPQAFFIVCQADDFDASGAMPVHGSQHASYIKPLYRGPTGHWAFRSDAQYETNVPVDLAAHYFYSVLAEFSQAEMWMDGTKIAGPVNTGNYNSDGGFSIGSRYDLAAGTRWDGIIAEVLKYPGGVSADTRTKALAYLQNRWFGNNVTTVEVHWSAQPLTITGAAITRDLVAPIATWSAQPLGIILPQLASIFLDLEDTPADFDSMLSLAGDFYIVEDGTQDDDTLVLYAQVYESDESTPLTDEVTVCSFGDGSGLKHVDFTGVVAGDKTTWDAARVKLTWINTVVGSDDLLDLRLQAFEITGTYNTGAAQPQSVNLVAPTAAWSASALTVTGAAATVNLVAGGAAWSAQALTATNPATIALVAPTAHWSAQALTTTGAAVTVNLVAATAAWSARPLTTTGAAATVDLVAATATWSARALTATGAALTVSLVAATATWSARALTATGAALTVDLAAATASWSAGAFIVSAGEEPKTVNLVAATATWSARALTTTGAAATVNLVAATATWNARSLSVTGAAFTVSIVAVSVTWSARALTVTGAPKTVALVAALATWSAQALTVTGAALTVSIAAATATWSACPLDVAAGVAPQTVNLGPAYAAWSARALTVTGAAATVTLVAATATWSARPLAIVIAAVTINLVAAQAHWSAQALTVTGQPVTVALSPALAAWTARPLDVIAVARINLIAAIAHWTAQPLTATGAANTVVLVAAIATWLASRLAPATAVFAGTVIVSSKRRTASVRAEAAGATAVWAEGVGSIWTTVEEDPP